MNRRTILRGAGVALALPWLESLAPRAAGAAVGTGPKRFLPIFFPNGAAEWWRPAAVGQGDAWQLSPILQPFQALKKKMIVVTNLEAYTPFAATAFDKNAKDPTVQLGPSHGQAPGAFLACVDANVVRTRTGKKAANGITVDQVIAQNSAYANLTKLASMQVGLSTVESGCDGRDCSVSRSISWKSELEPTYKDVDPGTIFDNIVGAIPPTMPGNMPDPEVEKRKALGQSVLDAVLASATRTRGRLGTADQKTLDQFMDSVRTVEKDATGLSNAMNNVSCSVTKRPTMKAQPSLIAGNVTDPTAPFYPYSKEDHANIMNDLIVMAFQCDVTRVISYMMEDERSEFVYSHVPMRHFTAAGSSPVADQTKTAGNYHGAQHAGSANDDFATINWWQSTKVAALAQRLDAITDFDGKTMLDNTVMLYAGCMHGGNHCSNDLPVALIGGGTGSLLTDQHVKFGDTPGTDRPLRDLYYTLLQKTYGINVPSFGVHNAGLPNSLITQILNA